MVDALIIGGGPAGLAAAVYLARQRLSVTVVADLFGGQTVWSSDIENYLGFHLLDGITLVQKFREHLKDYTSTLTIQEGVQVKALTKMAQGFHAETTTGSVDARLVLVASGSKHRELKIPGEKELYGHGVTYCATCDAPLFRDKRVAVIGGGNSAMDGALFAAKYAHEVLLVTVNAELRGDVVMKKKVLAQERIKVLAQTRSTKIVGGAFVTGIGLQGADGVERIEPCEGVFIEIGLVPSAECIDLVAKDKWGQIIVDKFNATNVEGIWAAGDVTDVAEKQIAVAVGEGSKAALSMIKYLQTHE